MKTVEEMAMELCGKTGLAGSAWARDNRWLAIYDALSAARASALEQAAKVADGIVAEHDRQNTCCRQSGFCECFGYKTIERIATNIRALAREGE